MTVQVPVPYQRGGYVYRYVLLFTLAYQVLVLETTVLVLVPVGSYAREYHA